MIINPIIPIWLMVIICFAIIILLFYNSNTKIAYVKELYKEKKLMHSKFFIIFA